ncbi:MAG: sulfatase [Lentisphaeraceae bacterium]|nr:sulfatase [Lentisphaeraceae bacterium]
MTKVLSVLLIGLGLTLSAAQKPNIVFILADDISRDTWGVYGSKDCKTPNIDKLAQDGMKFERAYCTVAMCAPFRQELYSGRSPWRTGTLSNHSKSTEDTKSIPHYLKPLGYRVALTGKSHVGPAKAYPFEILKGGKENKSFVANANKFFDECKKDSTPFCLFIASHDGHAPFTTGDASQYDATKLTVPPYWLDTPVLRENLVKYYAEISNFDSLVGKVRGLLEKKGLWENTIFVVCSEQGAQFPFAKWTCYDNGLHTGIVMSWPGVIKPGSKADTLISTSDITPTFVNAAGGTLKEGDVDGKSFLKTLKGEEQVINDYVYGAFTNCNIIDNRDRIYPIRVIRNKDFTLIYNPNHKSLTSNVTLTGVMQKLHNAPVSKMKEGDPATSWLELKGSSANADALIYKLNKRPEFELYNRKNDPYELKNEIENPEYKAIVEKMKSALLTKLSELGDKNPMVTEKKLVKAPKAKKKK